MFPLGGRVTTCIRSQDERLPSDAEKARAKVVR